MLRFGQQASGRRRSHHRKRQVDFAQMMATRAPSRGRVRNPIGEQLDHRVSLTNPR